jgi:hypothetical protein
LNSPLPRQLEPLDDLDMQGGHLQIATLVELFPVDSSPCYAGDNDTVGAGRKSNEVEFKSDTMPECAFVGVSCSKVDNDDDEGEYKQEFRLNQTVEYKTKLSPLHNVGNHLTAPNASATTDYGTPRIDEENNTTAILELPPPHHVEPFNDLDRRGVDGGHFQLAKLVELLTGDLSRCNADATDAVGVGRKLDDIVELETVDSSLRIAMCAVGEGEGEFKLDKMQESATALIASGNDDGYDGAEDKREVRCHQSEETEAISYSMCSDDVEDVRDDGIGAFISDELAERVEKETSLCHDEGENREVECELTEIEEKTTVQYKDSVDSRPSTQIYEEEKNVAERVQMETEEAKEDDGATHTDDPGDDENSSESESDDSSHEEGGGKEKKRKKPQEGHGTKSRRNYSSEALFYDALTRLNPPPLHPNHWKSVFYLVLQLHGFFDDNKDRVEGSWGPIVLGLL